MVNTRSRTRANVQKLKQIYKSGIGSTLTFGNTSTIGGTGNMEPSTTPSHLLKFGKLGIPTADIHPELINVVDDTDHHSTFAAAQLNWYWNRFVSMEARQAADEATKIEWGNKRFGYWRKDGILESYKLSEAKQIAVGTGIGKRFEASVKQLDMQPKIAPVQMAINSRWTTKHVYTTFAMDAHLRILKNQVKNFTSRYLAEQYINGPISQRNFDSIPLHLYGTAVEMAASITFICSMQHDQRILDRNYSELVLALGYRPYFNRGVQKELSQALQKLLSTFNNTGRSTIGKVENLNNLQLFAQKCYQVRSVTLKVLCKLVTKCDRNVKELQASLLKTIRAHEEPTRNDKKITVGFLNAGGITGKSETTLTEIFDVAKRHSTCIIGVVDTMHSVTDRIMTPTGWEIFNYPAFRKDDTSRPRAGAIIAVKRQLNPLAITPTTTQQLEKAWSWVECRPSPPAERFFICFGYWPPDTNVHIDIKGLIEEYQQFSQKGPVYWAGDNNACPWDNTKKRNKEFNMLLSNTTLQHANIKKLYTNVSKTGTSVIDHILGSRQDDKLPFVKDSFKTENIKANTGHQMIFATLNVGKPKITKSRRFHMARLKSPAIDAEFKNELLADVEKLQQLVLEPEIFSEQFQQTIVNAQERICKGFISTNAMTHHKELHYWWNSDIQEQLNLVRDLTNKVNKANKSRGKKSRLKAKKLKQQLLSAKDEWKKRMKKSAYHYKADVTDLEENGTIKQATWRMCRTLRKGKSNGTLYDYQAAKDFWSKLVTKQSNATELLNDMELEQLFISNNEKWGTSERTMTKCVTADDVATAKIQLPNGKTAGVDEITNEALKHMPVAFDSLIASFFNNCLEQGTFPLSMRTGAINLIKKPGKNGDLPSDWRPIALLSTMKKLLGTILLRRMERFLEKYDKLGDYQAGFRARRSCTQQAFVLQTLMQKAKKGKKEDMVIVFLDVAKAFDTVSHSTVLLKAIKIGLPITFVKALSLMLKDMRYFIRNNCRHANKPDDLTDYFTVSRGCPQGDILSPLLYVLFANDLANHQGLHSLGPDFNGTMIGNAMFADDTATIATGKNPEEAWKKAQQQLDLCTVWAKENQMTFNADKSTAMHVTSGKQLTKPLKISGDDIPWSTDFRYLGIDVCNTGKGKNWNQKKDYSRN